MKRIIAFFILLVTVFSLTAGAFSVLAVTQSEVDKLQKELDAVTKQKNALKKQMNEISSQKNTMASNINKLDKKISAAEKEIELEEKLVDKLNDRVAEKRAELEAAEGRAHTQYEGMKARLRFMAEHGNQSYLSILLSADSFNDFLTKYEVLREISKADSEMFDKYKANCEEVEQQKKELEASLKDAERQEKILRANKLEYESEMAQREKQLDKLAQQEKDAKASYNSIAKEEEELIESIKNKVNQLGKSSVYVGGKFQWPLPAANNVVTCKYGMRTHPITKVYKLHTGVDLRASKGTNIYAANSGKVITSTYSNAYGNYVVIDHGGGVATLYAHMTTRKVSVGNQVKQGQVIGLVGSTGYSTGPHLHFEIIKNGNYVDPVKEFPGFKVTYK